ncbi:MAG TPA: aminotransferase class III-fold pyridoxal phosphate-dependent enzyme [Steroidobacteraceae bacterium]|nr:aminotransferase class III-fold pyridoxal phosphate-dependent enzyme [Steroidobacteraceae bacterium]
MGRAIALRVSLSLAKHPSLRGHARWARRVAHQIRYFEYAPDNYFATDAAPQQIAATRCTGLARLRRSLVPGGAQSLRYMQSLETCVSDVSFTAAYRVPFPYRAGLPPELRHGSVLTQSAGMRVCDLDGIWRYDLSGSYGLNVFGYDFYKGCLAAGFAEAQSLGPLLGAYHCAVQANVQALRAISGLDEVSFHMSGTEAVMQAVRLARYHTRRSHLVRLCGAYHGWWDGVQPGVGHTRAVDDVYTLADLCPQTLRVLEQRRDIACVLINPLQALHPNSEGPVDSALLASDRHAGFDRDRYTQWLAQLRAVCSRRGIVLIFDEVLTGFRLGLRGAQGYFGVTADLVTYGKTLGGGLPLGVLCGRAELMRRFRDSAPADLCLARGTFSAHPYVMACMRVFLERIRTPELQACYATADSLWKARVAQLNAQLAAGQLPVRIAHLQSVMTVLYQRPSRYNWMLQFYLRAEGLELSWIGTGRLILPINCPQGDFEEVTRRIVRAARQMLADGWWWQAPHLTNRWIKRQLLRDLLRARLRGARAGAEPVEAARAPVMATQEVVGPCDRSALR